MNKIVTEFQNDVPFVLANIAKRGVKLWVENGRLRYRAPRGSLSADDLQTLKLHSRKIIDLLEHAVSRTNKLTPIDRGERSQPCPLTFTQLKYWRSGRLHNRPSTRTVTFALRIHGPLDIPILERSINEVVRRHEALRTKIVIRDGDPMQLVYAPSALFARVADIRGLSEAERSVELTKSLNEFLLEPVDVAFDPLLAVQIIRIKDQESLLIVAMEHIAADGFSRGIALRDLLEIYRHDGCGASLPEITIQFIDYAVWQHRSHAAWRRKSGDYWDAHLAGARRLRRHNRFTNQKAATWETVQFSIDNGKKQGLIAWARDHRTTAVLTALTAFVALVLRCYETRDALVRYQTDGRNDPLLKNTIGYFAAALSLRVRLSERDTMLDLLAKVTQEYCDVSEHADFDYLETQVPMPEYIRNPGFNWIPGIAKSQSTESDLVAGLTLVPESLPIVSPPLDDDYDLDYEPAILLYETNSEIQGYVVYSPLVASREMMLELKGGFLLALETIVNRPEQVVAEMPLGRSCSEEGVR